MIIRYLKYSLILSLFLPQILFSQENISREVKLYNPFKPTLSWENKLNFSPEMNDSVVVAPLFDYNISPQAFMPEYTIRTIGAARLEPDPLGRLYKSFLNIGFGNYFSPVGELSISSERSKDKIVGFYAGHNSSFGKVKLENDKNVYAGYMDNSAILYGTKLFRRNSLSANIDFQHKRRYAYGYDTNIAVPDMERDSLRIEYFNPSASINMHSIRIDSTHLDYDVDIYYNLLMQNRDYYRHNAGAKLDLSYKFKPVYATASLGYDLYMFSDAIGNNPHHIVSIAPSISRKSDAWAFKAGFKMNTYSRDIFSDTGREYKTNIYLYPDVRFRFTVIPSFVMFYVALDGEFEDNRALSVINQNPFMIENDPVNGIVPGDTLYRIRPTDNKLRVSGGLLGSAGDYTTYKIRASYTLFEDMLFFTSDAVFGRGFSPLYDDGELLNIYGEFNSRINDKFSISAKANFYSYKLETQEHPWYLPSWDGQISLKYNLRNKILANIDIYGLSERSWSYGPMPYFSVQEPVVEEFPMHFSMNMGLEYRYTKILSFWTRLNNISTNRYYEFGFYPSQRFLFMAGFTYSM